MNKSNIVTINKPIFVTTKGINHALIFGYYKGSDLLRVVTSPIKNIDMQGLTACNGYCITIDTNNSQYKLIDVKKQDYFNLLSLIDFEYITIKEA